MSKTDDGTPTPHPRSDQVQMRSRSCSGMRGITYEMPGHMESNLLGVGKRTVARGKNRETAKNWASQDGPAG